MFPEDQNALAAAIAIIVIVAGALFSSGCSRGFKMEFGIAPVTEIHESQHLTQIRGD